MNKKSRLLVWSPLLAAALVAAGMWFGLMLGGGRPNSPAHEKLNTVFDLIRDEYVEEVSSDSLVELTIPELLRNLDPHSVYIPRDELEMANRDLESSFFGVGVQFQIMDDSICVVEVISGGPAEKVGMRAGDRIIAVDGKNMTGTDVTNEAVFAALRGAKDTKVSVTVKRNGTRKPVTFDIVRGEIPTTSIDAKYLIEDSIGYIRLGKFANNTYSEFLQAANSLRHKGATGYIIDLRGNSGGLLDQAILIANELFSQGDVLVETRGRNKAENLIIPADGTGSFFAESIVVLVDEFTASSSEILAGAIQDNDRGLIIGRRTFGKGLVQRMITLPDSSQIRLTVQRYYTPSGRCIQKDYKAGSNTDYEAEIYDRYTNGEIFAADTTKYDAAHVFTTVNGRKVFGGGGILPDIFVPSDTTGITSYYLSVANAGLLQKFAYEYADINRDQLEKARNVEQLKSMLPSNDILLGAFVNYAADNGIARRWYYINNSARLIVNQLKALIARDILGMDAYFEIVNPTDPTVKEAVKQIHQGVDRTILQAIEEVSVEEDE